MTRKSADRIETAQAGACQSRRRRSLPLSMTAAVLALGMAVPAAWAQGNGGGVSRNQQITGSNAKIAGVQSLAADIAIWQYAVQKWATNTAPACHNGGGCDTWNQNDSASPVPSSIHVSQGQNVLLYAGPDRALCNAAAMGVTSGAQMVDMTQQPGYLPNGFGSNPPYAGEYCAVIEPNTGTATNPQSTVTGPTGTNLVPISTVVAYFVAGSKTAQQGLVSSVPSDYATAQSGHSIARHFAGGGNTIYSPGTGGWTTISH